MAIVLNVWETEVANKEEFIRGTIHESQTDDARGIKSTFILYIRCYKTTIPPIGFSGFWFSNLNSAKQFFKRNWGSRTRLTWKKCEVK